MLADSYKAYSWLLHMTFTLGALLHMAPGDPNWWRCHHLIMHLNRVSGRRQRRVCKTHNDLSLIGRDTNIATDSPLTRASHVTLKREAREWGEAWTANDMHSPIFHRITIVPDLWLLLSIDYVLSFSIKQAFTKLQLQDQHCAKK